MLNKEGKGEKKGGGSRAGRGAHRICGSISRFRFWGTFLLRLGRLAGFSFWMNSGGEGGAFWLTGKTEHFQRGIVQRKDNRPYKAANVFIVVFAAVFPSSREREEMEK